MPTSNSVVSNENKTCVVVSKSDFMTLLSYIAGEGWNDELDKILERASVCDTIDVRGIPRTETISYKDIDL